MNILARNDELLLVIVMIFVLEITAGDIHVVKGKHMYGCLSGEGVMT